MDQELSHGLAHAKNLTGGQAMGQVLRHQAFVGNQLLKAPERKLGIVGRQTNGLITGIRVGLVIPDLAPIRLAFEGVLAFGGIAQRVANGQAKQHPLNAIERKR